jgi:WD40 repeat protein
MSLLITPLAELNLPYVATFLVATPDSQIITVASSEGDVSVMDGNLLTLYSYNLGFSIADLTINPNGEILAATGKNGQFVIFKTNGEIIFEQKISHYDEDELDYGCLFSADGTKLWDISENIDGQIIIQYRETKSWQVLKQAFIPNPGDCYFNLLSHPKSEMISVSETAGQDGSWTYWVWDNDREMRVEEVSTLEETVPPEFHAEGKEFLAFYYNKAELIRYSFPDCIYMGSMTLELEGNDFLSFHQCYLSKNRAIVKSENGRLFMISLNQMKVLDEIILQGHEPCKKEDYSYTDISWFKGIGENRILSIHRHDYREKRNTLLLWEI